MDINSFFTANSTFLISSTKKPAAKLKPKSRKQSEARPFESGQNKGKSLIQDKDFCDYHYRRLKTQSQMKVKRIRRKKDCEYSITQLSKTKQKRMGIRSRPLTFEHYYKNIKLKQQEQKVYHPQQQKERASSLNFTRQLTTNFNLQMLQSMKKYLRKVQKSKSSTFSPNNQKNINYRLDIKAIQTKAKNYSQEFLKINMAKRTLKEPFNFVKKSRSKTEVSTKSTQQGIQIVKSRNFSSFLNTSQKQTTDNDPRQKRNFVYLQNDQKPLLKRFQGMTNNIDLILNSFKCIQKRQKTPQNLDKKGRKANKSTFYIGYGNNKNLIRSIMKKRWWWAQTQQIKKANFVWTQLKVNSILDSIESRTQKKIVNLQNTFQCFTEENEKTFLKKQKRTLDSLNKTQISLSKHPNMSKTCNIVSKQSPEEHQKYTKIFHQQTKINNDLKSNKSQLSTSNLTLIQLPVLVHNHYRSSFMFGNKNALFHNIKVYFQFLGDQGSLEAIIPKTYYLQKVDKVGIRQFQVKQFANSALNSASFRKGKAQNSNRGQGISVHTSFQSISKQIRSSKNVGKFIVQKYIRNVFLYQKRKFDIRTYVLMVTIGATTKFFWYNQGYLRTCSEYYNTNDIDDIFIHLTNDAIQCGGQKYGKFEPGNKISYPQFQRYLQANHSKQMYSMDSLNKKMKGLASHAVRAIYPKMGSQKVNYSFQLFGLDFLIDNRFNPWLLQVNTNPCLQLSSPVLQRLIPRMLQNMFRLSLDPVFQPCQQLSKMSTYFIYDNFFQANRFQLIFDSNFDQNQEWMHQCKIKQQQIYPDDNQVFQNQGQQVNLVE